MLTPALPRPAVGSPVDVTRRLSRAAAVLVLVLASLVVLGWVFRIDTLRSPTPGPATMKFNTALALALLASGVLLGRARPRGTTTCAAVVILLTTLTLIEHLTGWSLAVDELLVGDDLTSGSAPGRMAPATAVALLLLATAQVANSLRHRRLTQLLLVAPGAVGILSLLGYAFSVGQLYELGPFATVSLQTAIALTLLVIAEAAMIEGGVTGWVLTDPGLGATAIRRIGPAIILGLPLLGFALARLEQAERLGPEIALALTVLLGMGLVVVALVMTARQLDVVEARRSSAQTELELLNASLVEGRDAAWRRAEELSARLEAEQARFDRAVANLDDVLWTLHVLPEHVVLEYVSPGAERMLAGPLPDDLDLGRLLAERVPPEDRAATAELIRNVRAGRPADVRFRLTGYDGTVRWVWVRGQPRREGDQILFDGLVSDVTREQQLADERDALLAVESERVQELQELTRVRDEFLAVAGHELRTPLAAIRGFSELALDGDLPSPERDYVRVIAHRARQISRMVEDLFDLTKLQADMVELSLERVDLHRLAEETAEAHQADALSTGVRLEVSGEPAWLDGDPTRLRQILDNLVSNAVKYTGPEGQVLLECRGGGDQVTLTVSDTGMGIAAEDLPHVFEGLFRAASAREHQIPGTGLGLAVTKALVEAHGGSIEAESQLGRGSRFVVRLPRSRVTPG